MKLAFKTLILQDQIPLKLCLFIDGLDEYDGDEYEIAELFGEISKSPNSKCCVSSRPHLPFQEAFTGLLGLRLEDLTLPDIQKFASDKLENDKRMQRLTFIEPDDTPKLVEEIVTSANGVFLWVKLVVASLLSGLGNHDQVSDLRARLRVLPKDLEDLYEHMVLRVDESYRREALRLYQIVAAAVDSRPDDWTDGIHLTILGVVFAEEKDSDLAITAQMRFLEQAEVYSRCQRMMYQLVSRCGGLLEVQNGDHPRDEVTPNMKVSYMHRTVKDYLEKNDTRVLLRCRTGGASASPFDPNLAILRSYVLQLKVLDFAVPADQDPSSNAWDYIHSAIRHARRVDTDSRFEPDSLSAHVALLDQLYTTALYWVRRRIPSDSREAIFRSSSSAYTFAVECGLHQYLNAKLDKDNIIPKEKFGWKSLLDAALVSLPANRHLVSSKIVSVLVDHGARPLEAWPGALRYLRENFPPEEDHPTLILGNVLT